jgi:transposase
MWTKEGIMDVLYPRCAGLDVHKDSVVAAVRLAVAGAVNTEVRTFDTTTPGLLTLSGWLAEHGCTHVAMEATGVYWKPVWHILSDGDVTLILAMRRTSRTCRAARPMSPMPCGCPICWRMA